MRVEMDGKGGVSYGRGYVRVCGAGSAGEKRSGGRRRGGGRAVGPPPPHALKKVGACARNRTQGRERGGGKVWDRRVGRAGWLGRAQGGGGAGRASGAPGVEPASILSSLLGVEEHEEEGDVGPSSAGPQQKLGPGASGPSSPQDLSSRLYLSPARETAGICSPKVFGPRRYLFLSRALPSGGSRDWGPRAHGALGCIGLVVHPLVPRVPFAAFALLIGLCVVPALRLLFGPLRRRRSLFARRALLVAGCPIDAGPSTTRTSA